MDTRRFALQRHDRREPSWVGVVSRARANRVWHLSSIRRDTPLSLFDALALAAQARREIYLKDS
jgi:hypothetical protein